MHTRHRHLSGACDSLRALLFPLVTLLGSATVCLEAQTPNTSPSTTKPALGAEEPIEMMEFVVKEKGVSRATSTVTTRDVDISLPGASPILLLRNQPGVNITSSDPFGFFSEGGDIRVRAFTIGVLAVTIDGVPMGSNSTRYGTPASRIVDGEDLKSIQVNAGTGDVTTPAFEALGGSIQYFTKAPAPVMSAHLVQTLGSWDYRRTYARFDTGEILPGLTGFVSTSAMAFKSLLQPEDGEVEKVNAALRYALPRTTVTLAFTHSDRDDFDQSRSIRWDYWRAMETGDPFSGYDRERYLTTDSSGERVLNAEGNSLTEFARLGFTEYTGANAPLMTPSLLKDYGDTGRRAVRRTTLDSSENLGDAPNNGYYYYGRNGRIDDLSRVIVDHSFTDDLTGKFIGYYQHKQYYGTAYQPRSTVLGVVRSAYLYPLETGKHPDEDLPSVIREDIWARYAYGIQNDAGDWVIADLGTPGAVPLGFDDLNNNGIFDPGEALDPSAPVSEFGWIEDKDGDGIADSSSNAARNELDHSHALIAPLPAGTPISQARTAIPGATARDEEFGGYRWGLFPKFTWNLATPLGRHRITSGIWFEKDVQNTSRPHYNLFEGSPTGAILYDQAYFNNYIRHFVTESTQIFIEDQTKWFDERLIVTLGAKSLNVDRSVEGMIDSSLFPLPDGQRYKKNEATYKDSFLPQAGFTYKLTSNIEVFSSYAVNISAPTQDVMTSLQFNEGLEPEKATNYEAGVRRSTASLDVQLAFFYNAYEERLVTIPLTEEEQAILGTTGFVGQSVYKNVGGIDSQGAELSFDWRTPVKGLSLTGSVAFQDSTFTENLRVSYQSFMGNPADPRSRFYEVIPNPDGGTPKLAWELQEGKTQGNTPEFTANLDAFYRWRNFSVNFGGRYYDEVYANRLNTEVVPSYTTFRAGASVRGPKGTRFEPFTLSARVENLFDQYIFTSSSGTGSFDGSVTADYGRTILVTVEAKF